MSKRRKNIPELRFPDFEDEGEWLNQKLSNISEIIMGSSPSSSSYNENKIGLPLLQGNADIKNRLSAPRIYTSEITKECEIGDILLSVRAPVGTVAKSLHKACIGRGISALRVLKPNYQEYLYQWLFSYESSWKNISQGGTFDAVNSDDIKDLLVPVPNPKEQQKIASCLFSIDEVIAAHSQKLELLKEHKKGLMQNLFPQEGEKVPKYRFKEFAKDGEWEKKKLEEVIDLLSGYAFESQYFSKDGFKLITPKNFTKDGFATFTDENTKYTTEIADDKYWCIKGDLLILITDLTPSCELLGKPVLLTKKEEKVLLNQRIVKVIPKGEILLEFLLQFFLTDTYHTRIKSTATGSTVRHSSNKIILETVILLPFNLKEQQKIASCLSALDSIITEQSKKIKLLKLHKKGLMQGLFPKVIE